MMTINELLEELATLRSRVRSQDAQLDAVRLVMADRHVSIPIPVLSAAMNKAAAEADQAPTDVPESNKASYGKTPYRIS